MIKRKLLSLLSILFLPVMLASAQEKPAPAEQAKPAEGEGLAKAAQNPIASLSSVPLQNNTACGIGPFDPNENVLNIQLVIPVRISENWNMISRIITPIVFQPLEDPPGNPNTQGTFGLGDINPTFFFSPESQAN